MAKYCMFCGKSLPDAAQFCPYCGKSQVLEETQEEIKNVEIEVEEDTSDELDLLSQFGYIAPKAKKKTPPPFTPTKQPQHKEQPQPIRIPEPVVQEQPKPEKAVEPVVKQAEPEPVETPIKTTIFNEPQKPENTGFEEEVPEEKPEIKTTLFEPAKEEVQQNNIDLPNVPNETIDNGAPLNNNQNISPEPVQSEILNTAKNTTENIPNAHSRRRRLRDTSSDSAAIPFQPTEIKNENAIPTESTAEARYEIPDEISSFVNNDDDYGFGLAIISDEELEEEERQKEEEERQKAELERSEREDRGEMEAISAKKKSRLPFMRKKQETVSQNEDDEEENFETDIGARAKSASMVSHSTMYADEIEDAKRRKETVVVDDDDDEEAPARERRRSTEGRKVNTQQRRRSSRTADINRKVYNIEQDTSQLDPEEINYDGYYENVLPIDINDQKKRRVDKRTVLIVLGAAVGITLLIVLTIKLLPYL